MVRKEEPFLFFFHHSPHCLQIAQIVLPDASQFLHNQLPVYLFLEELVCNINSYIRLILLQNKNVKKLTIEVS